MTRHVPRLHVLTDRQLQGRWSHLDLARAAVAGGADLVQLRDKRATDEELFAEAQALVQLVRAAGAVPLLNDRLALAVRLGVALHVGATDTPPAAARAALGPAPLLGLTVNDLDTLRRVRGAPVDYLGVGPVFGTSSKANPAPTLGLRGLAAICAESPVPVVAIGGIRPEHVGEILAAGAHGVAVLGAVCLADDPAAATAAFAEALSR